MSLLHTLPLATQTNKTVHLPKGQAALEMAATRNLQKGSDLVTSEMAGVRSLQRASED